MSVTVCSMKLSLFFYFRETEINKMTFLLLCRYVTELCRLDDGTICEQSHSPLPMVNY